MALSKKQRVNIEYMWGLEDRVDKIYIEMAEAIRELAMERAILRAEIHAVEDQVPDSYEDAWSNEDRRHRRLPEVAEQRRQWSEAYSFIRRFMEGGRPQ
jgi:hypothetical protein